MRYVIRRRRRGLYVADQRKRAGGSYTNKLEHAKIYKTFEAAKNDSCPGNEVVVDIKDILC